MTVIVGTTAATYKVDGSELNWLTSAEQMLVDHEDTVFFAALELLQGREFSNYGPLRKRLGALPNEVWTFSLDDKETTLTTKNRLRRICIGRNLVIEFAIQQGADHVLFIDSDLIVPGDSISKLLELDAPIVGGDIPNYGLSGDEVDGYSFPVQRHWTSAGFLLVHREVFRRVRWRYDWEAQLSDDPCYANDAVAAGFGGTLVRKDLIGLHAPLIPVEERGHNLRLS